MLLTFCWWDLPALIVLAAVALICAVRHWNLKKREQDLEDQLSALYVEDML